jgi:hypothetical protein
VRSEENSVLQMPRMRFAMYCVVGDCLPVLSATVNTPSAANRTLVIFLPNVL